MEYLLFAAYLVLFAWLVTKVKFFTRSGLTPSQLVIFFLLKVMAGILYGWIGVYYGQMAQMVDTWAYHYQALDEYRVLLSNPAEFFTAGLKNNYNSYGSFFSSHNSWWNDLKSNSYVKIIALMDVFSFGHYYINVIFYSFLTFFGPIAVFRVMKDVYPKKRIAVLLATFLIPSFLYWTSGLHKEGLLFLSFALVIYNFYFGLKELRFPVGRILSILLGILLVLALRNFLIVVLVPALIAWALAARLPYRPSVIYTICYLFFFIVFFTSRYINPKLDFLQAVAAKQQDFIELHGATSVNVTKLEPTFSSFLKNTPQALSLSTIRPYPSDVRHLLSLAAATEVGFLLLLLAISLVWRSVNRPDKSFLLFCFFFSFSLLLMIGMAVNNIGAIVRYRSIVLPFLVIPIFVSIDWNRIYGYVFNNIELKNNV